MPQEGKKIYVESIMTREEWKQRCKNYPNTSHIPEPPEEFECDFKWRKGMGANVSPQEIARVNARIEEMLRTVKQE